MGEPWRRYQDGVASSAAPGALNYAQDASSAGEWATDRAKDQPSRTSRSGEVLTGDHAQSHKQNLGSFPPVEDFQPHDQHTSWAQYQESSHHADLPSLPNETSALALPSRSASAEFYSPKEAAISGLPTLPQSLPPIPEASHQTTGYAGYDEPFVPTEAASFPPGFPPGIENGKFVSRYGEDADPQHTRDMRLSWQSQQNKDEHAGAFQPNYYRPYPGSDRPDAGGSSYIDESGHYLDSSGQRPHYSTQHRQPSLPPYSPTKLSSGGLSQPSHWPHGSNGEPLQRPHLPHHSSYPSYHAHLPNHGQLAGSFLPFLPPGGYSETPRSTSSVPGEARHNLHLSHLPPAPSWLVHPAQSRNGEADTHGAQLSPSAPMQMNSVAHTIGGITPDMLTPESNKSYFPDVAPVQHYSAPQTYFDFSQQVGTQQGSHPAPISHNQQSSLDIYDSPAVTIASLPSPALFTHQLSSDYQGKGPPYSTTPGGVPEGYDYFQLNGIVNAGGYHPHYRGNTQQGPLVVSGTPTSPSFSGSAQHSFSYRSSAPSTSAGAARAVIDASGNAKSKGKRENRKQDGICEVCLKTFTSIYLRGQDGDFNVSYKLSYICAACAAANPKLQLSRRPAETVEVSASSAEDSALAPVTALTPIKTPSVATSGKGKDKGSKKRTRTSDLSSPAVCDVCSRIVGYGAPLPMDGKSDLAFNIEIVCARCETRYARCSDCGGGGGARLGVGKWRCKELFSPGRRTCDLSHARQSNIASMQYHVVRIADVPQAEKAELVETCHKVFECSLYSSLAVPEVLERGTAMAETYDDVVDRVRTGWVEARTCLEQDVEAQDGFRRYLGLRWAAPKPRKTANKKNGDPSSSTSTDQEAENGSILKPGKNLSGYITAEWDIKKGTFFITVSVPYSTGEQYEGAAHLISLMAGRAIQEREQMIQSLKSQGRTFEADSIPPIQHTFTMLFFSRDSKVLTYLESKRQLIPLERYLEKYPDVDPTIFPPHRKCYLTLERQQGWTVLVRRIGPKPA